MRCAEARRQATAAAVLCDRFFGAGTSTGTNADGIGLSAVMSLLCCPAQSVIAQLSSTLLEAATFF